MFHSGRLTSFWGRLYVNRKQKKVVGNGWTNSLYQFTLLCEYPSANPIGGWADYLDSILLPAQSPLAAPGLGRRGGKNAG